MPIADTEAASSAVEYVEVTAPRVHNLHHDNLGCAVGNALAAAGAGATWIDGSVRGFGAGTMIQSPM